MPDRRSHRGPHPLDRRLFGADLLHLRDFTKVSAGVISIGGAGTFAGIVLSGRLAALLA